MGSSDYRVYSFQGKNYWMDGRRSKDWRKSLFLNFCTRSSLFIGSNQKENFSAQFPLMYVDSNGQQLSTRIVANRAIRYADSMKRTLWYRVESSRLALARPGWLIAGVPWRAWLARNYIYEYTWAAWNKVDHPARTSAMIFLRGCDGPLSLLSTISIAALDKDRQETRVDQAGR